jgi:hypothetical protein
MQVVVVIVAMTMTKLKTRTINSTLDGMHQMMLAEELQGAEYIRFVDGIYPTLQFGHRLW